MLPPILAECVDIKKTDAVVRATEGSARPRALQAPLQAAPESAAAF